MTPSVIREHAAKWVTGLLGLLLVGALLVLDKSVCPTAMLLGLPCPGCGMTRALLLLLTGNGTGALQLHPLSPAVAALGLGYATTITAARVWPAYDLGRHLTSERTRTRLALCGGAAMILVWGLRFFGHLGGPAPVQPMWDIALIDVAAFG